MPPRRATMRFTRRHEDSESRKRLLSPGDEVWCDFKGMYYKAKILEFKLKWDEHYYKIHYWKFSKKHDVTVRESKLLSFNKKKNNAFVQKHNRKYKELCKQRREEEMIIQLALVSID